MKKRVLGFCLGLIASISMATAAMGASWDCYTSISSNGATAMGVTDWAGANYCSANLTGVYRGGIASDWAEGVVACTAAAHVSATTPFTSASTVHHADANGNSYDFSTSTTR